MVNLVTCNFHSFEALNDTIFVRASFLHLIKDIDSTYMYGHAAQIVQSGNIVKQCL